MPIYGYRCQQCAHEMEVLQSMSDPPLRICPECMGPLRKMLYPVGVHFKGSGFYSTDYKSSKPGSNGADGGESKSSDSGSADKPAAKSSDSGSADKPAEKTDKTDKTDKTEKKSESKE